jgi:hypothetical protein
MFEAKEVKVTGARENYTMKNFTKLCCGDQIKLDENKRLVTHKGDGICKKKFLSEIHSIIFDSK